MYQEVADSPTNEFHFLHGRDAAERFEYDPDWLDRAPRGAVYSFASVGNPQYDPINSIYRTDSDITQLCQSLVNAFVDSGDSGSPVFGIHTDGTAFLAGIRGAALPTW